VQIAYGYVHILQNIYCRHCFIVATNTIIDPTLHDTHHCEMGEYFICKVFENISKYLDALETDNHFPDLTHFLYEYDKKAQQWANKNNLIFLM
jgi:hypothetical protein